MRSERRPPKKKTRKAAGAGSASKRARPAPRKSSRAPAPRAAAPRKPKVSNEPDLSAAPLLSPRRRRDLRGEAHRLQPLVQVGHEGVTPSIISAVGRALRDHELIKVRLHEPEDKKTMAEQLARESRSALCGLIGHTVILFKPKPLSKS